jgi:hypothetical protein
VAGGLPKNLLINISQPIFIIIALKLVYVSGVVHIHGLFIPRSIALLTIKVS